MARVSTRPPLDTRTRTRTVAQTVNGQTTYRTVTETYTEQVFDGYRTTRTFIAAFDPDGTVAWTHTFPMDDVLSHTLRKRVRLTTSAETVHLRYAYWRRLHTQIVRGGVLVTRDEERLDAVEDDRVKNAWNTDTAFWHDDVFAVWGQQKLKGSDGKRFVFFVRTIGPD